MGGMGHSVWSPRSGGMTGVKPWFGQEPSPWLGLSVHGTGAAGRAKSGNLNFEINMARSLSRLCALPASWGQNGEKGKKVLRMCKSCLATAKKKKQTNQTLLCFHAGLVTNKTQHQAHQQGTQPTPSLPHSVG